MRHTRNAIRSRRMKPAASPSARFAAVLARRSPWPGEAPAAPGHRRVDHRYGQARPETRQLGHRPAELGCSHRCRRACLRGPSDGADPHRLVNPRPGPTPPRSQRGPPGSGPAAGVGTAGAETCSRSSRYRRHLDAPASALPAAASSDRPTLTARSCLYHVACLPADRQSGSAARRHQSGAGQQQSRRQLAAHRRCPRRLGDGSSVPEQESGWQGSQATSRASARCNSVPGME
jgi:hypothetical protein